MKKLVEQLFEYLLKIERHPEFFYEINKAFDTFCYDLFIAILKYDSAYRENSPCLADNIRELISTSFEQRIILCNYYDN